MLYLSSIKFPDEDKQYKFILKQERTCYNSFYPFMILTKHQFNRIDFENITILYGNNGCGKSTALNIIAQKLEVERSSVFNKTSFYQDFVDMCSVDINSEPYIKRIITSDDIFDYMLNIRTLNQSIDYKREDMFKEYIDLKYSKVTMNSLDDYEDLKRSNYAKRITQSKFIKEHLTNNVRTYSNGESSYKYFLEKIDENGLFILDEPENSLSPSKQIELIGLIQDYTKYFGCQFIISTHSPFLLSIKNAKIYNLDEDPVSVRKWTELDNVKMYYEFFKERENEF